MATSQQFDTLDGLVVTGTMDVGANVTVDTNVLYVDAVNNRIGVNKVPTVAFDVNGDVNIDGGTIDGLTQLSVDDLTLNGQSITSSNNVLITADNDIRLRVGSGDQIRFQHGNNPTTIQFELDTGNTSTLYDSCVISTGGIGGVAAKEVMSLRTNGDAAFANNIMMSDGKRINFGSVMDITASATGASFSANTYHGGNIVALGDNNTYVTFNAADSIQLVTNGVVRLTANNSGVDIGTLISEAVLSETVIYETVQTEATYNIDLNDGSAVICSATGGGTVAFTMPTLGTSDAFAWTVKFNNSGTITWPAEVEWAEGVTPPVSSGTDIYSFVTYDGGTTIYGSLAVRNAS